MKHKTKKKRKRWSIRSKIYQILIAAHPEFSEYYQKIRRKRPGLFGRVYALLALLWRNLLWCLDRRVPMEREKRLPVEFGESSERKRETPEDLVKRLSAYDVLSFDLFDTLIFRPFEKPADLFYLVGEELGYLNFRQLRIEMEAYARQQDRLSGGRGEVTLEQIYQLLESYAGVPKEQGIQIESKLELELCMPNPYFLEVFRRLKENEKQILVISDMYLSSELLKKMTKKCGFSKISEFYISCEYKASKSDGSLFELVKEKYGCQKTYVHVGDHPVSDVRNAKSHGFTAVYYQNVNDAGAGYRAGGLSPVCGSVYRGLVNLSIYSGLKQYTKEYEWGFIYGGLLVYGYCSFIHDCAKAVSADKLLFLSRDGDILYRAYQILYPKEALPTAYVYWSRLAAVKMTADRFRYDYFRRFLTHKAGQRYSLEKIFQAMELTELLNPVVAELNRKGSFYTADSVLEPEDVPAVREALLVHWSSVLACYEEQTRAGCLYWNSILQGCKKVCAVDVGWAGSGAAALAYLVHEVMGLPCELIGLLAGTNTPYCEEPEASEALLNSKRLISYLFSSGHNRKLWEQHNPSKGHNLLIEVLFASPTPSLRSFRMEEGKTVPVFSSGQDGCSEAAGLLQEGVLDFVTLMKNCSDKFPGGIFVSGQDAYAPVERLEHDPKIVEAILNRFHFSSNLD